LFPNQIVCLSSFFCLFSLAPARRVRDRGEFPPSAPCPAS
jgi:hypothetical protein